MPPESEVIKQQMGQTRAALSEKLETLESQVLGTVRDTTSTVGSTVHEVGATVRDTMQDVRATVRETLATVKDSLDVSRQMQNHPWILLGGSMMAGFLTGRVLDSLESGRMPRRLSYSSAPDSLLSETPPGEPTQGMMAQAVRSAPSFLKSLADSFAPELAKVKGVAVGMAMSLLRDKLSQSVPPQYQNDLNDMMNRLTVKLGGEPAAPGTGFFGRDEVDEYERSERVRSMDL